MLSLAAIAETGGGLSSWADPFLRSLLDLWLDAYRTPNGVFHPYYDREWRRIAAEPRTLVSQCRLIHNFASGYEAFGASEYAAAAALGLDGLRGYFALDSGGYRWSVNEAGGEVDAIQDAYGHAFCILAHATAARAFDDKRLADAGLRVWRHVSEVFTDQRGGLVWHLNGPRCWDSPRSQNPLMHMFEALMALSGVDRTGEATAAAGKLLRFMMGLSGFSEGALREWHSADWKAATIEEGAVIELGHLFEWAFLCSEWARLSGDDAILPTGHAFLKTGCDWGMDSDGGVWHQSSPDGVVLSHVKGLWQQCEAVRALYRYVNEHGRGDLSPLLDRASAFYSEVFVDPEFGGVYAGSDHAVSADESAKGDSWKLDYHSVGMLLELSGRIVAPTQSV